MYRARSLRRWRSLGPLLGLVVARLRAAPARWLLPALGAALAVGLLGTAVGGGTVAGEAAARQTVRELPAAQRTVRVTWSGGLLPGVAARASAAVRSVAPGAQTTSLLYLATRFGASGADDVSVQVAAVAPLSRWVRLSAGRMPGRCVPARCEVLDLGGPAIPAEVVRNGLRLVTVGRGTLTSSVPLGFVPRATVAGARGGAAALRVTGDPAGLGAARGIGSVFRTWGWTAALDGAQVPSWQLDGLRRRLALTETTLRRADVAYAVTAPLGALAAARERAREARRRVVVLGAGATVLLAAFALLAAGALRRGLLEERHRLLRRGARPWQVEALSVAECAWPAVVGGVVGAVAALGVTALRSRADALDAGAVLDHALLGGGPVLAVVACVAGVTLLGWVGTRDAPPGANRLADGAALAAAGAVVLLVSRGDVDAGADDTLPAVLPLLVCPCAGLVTARLAAPLLRGAERGARHGPLALRLAALGLARAPGGPALTVGVVAVSCGLACFAAAYGATLHRGDRDQAAYAVPSDATVSSSAGFTSPVAEAPLTQWRALAGPGGAVLPVGRGSAAVPRGAVIVELPLLALPAAGLPGLRRVRDQDLSAPAGELARRLLSGGAPGASAPGADPSSVRPGTGAGAPGVSGRSPALVGAAVPAGGAELSVRAVTDADGLALTARLLGDDGGLTLVDLGTTGPSSRELRAPIPASAAGRHLVGFALAPIGGTQATGGHQEAEGGNQSAVATTLTLTRLRLGDQPVPFDGWLGRGAVGTPRAVAATATATGRPSTAAPASAPPTATGGPPSAAPSSAAPTATGGPPSAAPSSAAPTATGGPPSAAPSSAAPTATGGGSAAAPDARAGIAVTVRFDRPGRALLGPRQALDSRPLPVLADAATASSAGPGGVLPIRVDGEPARARVVGTLTRFPTVPRGADGVLVADDASVRSLQAAIGGGDARPDELWITTPDPSRLRAALARPPLSALGLTLRRDVQQRLADDPLARELSRTLRIAALVALGLAALGIALTIAAAVRDDSAAALDLEVLGVSPATLRADVRWRAALLCALGTLAGLAVGAALLRLTVDAVQLTAAGETAVPPLEAAAPWTAWAAIVAGLLLGVALLVALLTRRSFAAPLPHRASGARA